MSVKSDRWIRRMALEHDMISPFSEKQVSAGVLSYGVSSYSYNAVCIVMLSVPLTCAISSLLPPFLAPH
jgi:deoxycytidine triphosphate deaminase